MRLDGRLEFPGGCVPEFHGPVSARGGERLAVGCERNPADPAFVILQRDRLRRRAASRTCEQDRGEDCEYGLKAASAERK